MTVIDLSKTTIRDLNQRLHDLNGVDRTNEWRITNPSGEHAIAAGLNAPINVLIDGPVGYYCGGMNKEAMITIKGHCGWGVGENIMSGIIRVKGNASDSVGASGIGGLIVIEGDASSRCGISMKGVDIVVTGSVGHMSAFLAQKRWQPMTKNKIDVNDIYRRVIDRHGINNQLRMLTEECGELVAAVNRYQRGRTGLVDLLEEIADVENLLSPRKASGTLSRPSSARPRSRCVDPEDSFSPFSHSRA